MVDSNLLNLVVKRLNSEYALLIEYLVKPVNTHLLIREGIFIILQVISQTTKGRLHDDREQ